MSPVYIVMGVSGCGKTAIGTALAEALGCPFYDGDDYHPPENIAKMAAGIPLDDDDRFPWLARLRGLIQEHLAQGESAVFACSALKAAYRRQLGQGDPRIRFIYLRGDFDLIWQRLANRQDHYMQASMLQGQFQALEELGSSEALIVNIADDEQTIIASILRHYTSHPAP